MVLLHGLTASHRYVVMGSNALERAGHRVLAYDARGHGASQPGDRYDYDYSPKELEDWVRKIRELAEKASKVYVFFNNCHAGQAARNALLMRDMMQQDLMAGVR